MERIDLNHIQREHRALTAAWRRWEDDARTEPALRSALHATTAQVGTWEASGAYLGAQVDLLRDQVFCIEALLAQRQQERTRGY